MEEEEEEDVWCSQSELRRLGPREIGLSYRGRPARYSTLLLTLSLIRKWQRVICRHGGRVRRKKRHNFRPDLFTVNSPVAGKTARNLDQNKSYRK